jgi:hypothetical protein
MKKYSAVFVLIASLLVLTCNTSTTAPAEIHPGDVSLTISPQPANGTITVSPSGTKAGASYFFKPSTAITVSAESADSFVFSAWSGEFAGEIAPAKTITLDTDMVISATFVKAPTTPILTGTWGISGGIYTRGGVYGTFAFNYQSDTIVLKSDFTYTSYVKKSASINGSGFGGMGSGTWSVSGSTLSFGYPISQALEYTLEGNSLTLTDGAMTIYASRIH